MTQAQNQAMGNEFTEQSTSEDNQIREVQLQGFVSNKVEHLLYSRQPTSEVHDLATGYGSLQSDTCFLSLSLSVFLLFLNLSGRAFTMLPKLSSSFVPVSFCSTSSSSLIFKHTSPQIQRDFLYVSRLQYYFCFQFSPKSLLGSMVLFLPMSLQASKILSLAGP